LCAAQSVWVVTVHVGPFGVGTQQAPVGGGAQVVEAQLDPSS